MEMTTDGHVIGSEGSHDRRNKKDAKSVGRKVSQYEFDRVFVELKEKLSVVMKFL